MAQAAGSLWLSGVSVDWNGVWTHEQRRHVTLPTYPFQRERYWIDPPPIAAPAVPADPSGNGAALVPASMPEAQVVSQRAATEPVQAGEAPASAQEAIRRIWVELLGVPDVGPHDDFFELGGHSLLGTQVIARIRDALQVDLPPSALFEFPTIAGLAAEAQRLTPISAGDGDLPDLLAEIMALSPAELQEQLTREQSAAAVNGHHGPAT